MDQVVKSFENCQVQKKLKIQGSWIIDDNQFSCASDKLLQVPWGNWQEKEGGDIHRSHIKNWSPEHKYTHFPISFFAFTSVFKLNLETFFWLLRSFGCSSEVANIRTLSSSSSQSNVNSSAPGATTKALESLEQREKTQVDTINDWKKTEASSSFWAILALNFDLELQLHCVHCEVESLWWQESNQFVKGFT